MPVAEAFQYAVLQVVPDIERDERLNAGRRALLPPPRLPRGARRARRAHGSPRSRRAPTPARSRASSTGSCASPRATRPPARSRALPQSERFAWLVAPASTAIQPTAVHTGLCEDPAAALERLFERLVRAPGR